MENQRILKKVAGINFRQVVYIGAGVYFLISGILNRDWAMGLVSALFLYQGIFNTCLFGSCHIRKR